MANASVPLIELTLPERAEELARAYRAALEITLPGSGDYPAAHAAAMEAMRLAVGMDR